jgi:hypothetical protein
MGVSLMTPAGGSATPQEVDDGLGQTEKDADSKSDVLLLRDRSSDASSQSRLMVSKSHYGFPADATTVDSPAKGLPRCLDINDSR